MRQLIGNCRRFRAGPVPDKIPETREPSPTSIANPVRRCAVSSSGYSVFNAAHQGRIRLLWGLAEEKAVSQPRRPKSKLCGGSPTTSRDSWGSELLYTFCIALTRSQKRVILMSMEVFWLVVAFCLAQALVKQPLPTVPEFQSSLRYLLIIVPVGIASVHYLGLHRIKLNAYGMQGIIESGMLALSVGVAGFIASFVPWVGVNLPLSTFVVFPMLYLILSVSGRVRLRGFVRSIYGRGHTRKRVLIYGAGQTGQQLAAALFTDDELEPTLFIDDNPALQKLTVNGLRVYSPKHIRQLVKREKIDRIVLAMPSASQPVRVRIAKGLKGIGCEVMAMPSFAEMVVQGKGEKTPAPVELSTLLGRHGLEADLPTVRSSYKGHRILVTGAGGSIGSELCRQLLISKPEVLVLFEHSELALYSIQRELCDLAPHINVVPVLGSITRHELVQETMEQFNIQTVFHAAAYKHVPLVEENCLEGLRNNVLGSKSVADAAKKAGVDRFILVSSDKAVRPTSIMGSSKRMAELVVQDLATRSDHTRFSMVRFGNVLGSSGSVIPLFEDQIRKGGPVTVTHSDVTRYFMTVSEAVRLVLLAGSFARGGDVFVLDMGEPVVIHDIARQMIEGAGYTVKDDQNPLGEISIELTGLRPGEKMHEELLIGSDMLTTPHPKILRAQETRLSEIEIANALQELRRAIDSRDEALAHQVLGKWVETVQHDSDQETISQ